jgi:hypothetical protein
MPPSGCGISECNARTGLLIAGQWDEALGRLKAALER